MSNLSIKNVPLCSWLKRRDGFVTHAMVMGALVGWHRSVDDRPATIRIKGVLFFNTYRLFATMPRKTMCQGMLSESAHNTPGSDDIWIVPDDINIRVVKEGSLGTTFRKVSLLDEITLNGLMLTLSWLDPKMVVYSIWFRYGQMINRICTLINHTFIDGRYVSSSFLDECTPRDFFFDVDHYLS